MVFCCSADGTSVNAMEVGIAPRFLKKLKNIGDSGTLIFRPLYMPLIRALFCESNPIPVKAAMAALGYCDNYLRLPLVPMEEDHYQGMLQRMRELGLPV